MIKYTLLIVAAALIAGCGPSVQDGVAAYKAKDYIAARKVFEGNVDDRDAQFYLGEIYENGRAVAQDQKAAVDWYKKAADQAQPEAMYTYGRLQLEGKAVAKDVSAGVAMLEKAAQAGALRAYEAIGWYYRTEGRNLPLARDFYTKGGNSFYALWGLALLLENGGPGLRGDPVAARMALTTALENPDPKAPGLLDAVAFDLAEYYHYGFGGPVDFARAFELVQKYHSSIDNKAFFSWMKFTGAGVPIDQLEAVLEWLELDEELKGASTGRLSYRTPYLPLGLALAYNNGIVVKKDEVKAAQYESHLYGIGATVLLKAFWAAAGKISGGCDVYVTSADSDAGRYVAFGGVVWLEKAKCYKKKGELIPAYLYVREAEKLGAPEAAALKGSLLPALSPQSVKTMEALGPFRPESGRAMELRVTVQDLLSRRANRK